MDETRVLTTLTEHSPWAAVVMMGIVVLGGLIRLAIVLWSPAGRSGRRVEIKTGSRRQVIIGPEVEESQVQGQLSGDTNANIVELESPASPATEPDKTAGDVTDDGT